MSNDEMAAARAAIDAGEFNQARHHLNNLAADGNHAREVEELTRLIWWKEHSSDQQNLTRVGIAISVAVFGYAILSFQSPAAWGPVVWGIAAFLVLPCFVGALAGSSAGPKGLRFWRAFGIVSITVAIYTLIGLCLTRSKMQSADKSMDFIMFIVIMGVYGGVAGLVAGISGMMLRSSREAS